MSTPVFLNLARGNRAEGFLGLRKISDSAGPYRFANKYQYLELNLASVQDSDGNVLNGDKVTRNQSALLRSGWLLAPSHDHQALIVPNPLIFQYASAPSMLMVDTGDKKDIEVPVRTFRDLPLGELNWFVRVYLVS